MALQLTPKSVDFHICVLLLSGATEETYTVLASAASKAMELRPKPLFGNAVGAVQLVPPLFDRNTLPPLAMVPMTLPFPGATLTLRKTTPVPSPVVASAVQLPA